MACISICLFTYLLLWARRVLDAACTQCVSCADAACLMHAACVLHVCIHTEAVCTQHTGPSAASGIQFPDQSAELRPPALAEWHLSHWVTREMPPPNDGLSVFPIHTAEERSQCVSWARTQNTTS